jgi:hypothetical protein
MGRFTKAEGPAAASAEGSAGGQTPSLTPLSTLARMQPLPLSPVNTVARVTYIFGHTVGDLGGILWEWGNKGWSNLFANRGWPPVKQAFT